MNVGTLSISLELNTGDFAKKVNNAKESINQAAGKIKKSADRIESSVSGKFNKATQSVRSFSSVMQSGVAKITAVIGTMAAGGFIATKLAKDIASLEAMDRTMKFAVGTTAKASKAFSFLAKESARLGFSLEVAHEEFGKLAAAAKGTSLEGENIREVFIAVGEASAVMGLSSYNTSLIFKAFRDMISKGTINAEELKRQLGDQLPGAVQIMSRALGVGTARLTKLMETGQLVTSDVLPLLTKQMRKELAPEIANLGDAMQITINELSNAFFNLRRAIKESGIGDLLKGAISLTAHLTNSLADLIREGTGLGALSGYYARFSDDAEKSADAIDDVTKSLEDNSVAMEANKLAVEEMVAGFEKKFGNLKDELETTKDLLNINDEILKDRLTTTKYYDKLLDNLRKYYDEQMEVVSAKSEKVIALTASYEDLRNSIVSTKMAELADISKKYNNKITEDAEESFDKRFGDIVGVVNKNISGMADSLSKKTLNIRETFTEMVDSMVEDITRLVLQKTLVDGLVNSFESLLGKGGGVSGQGGGNFIGSMISGLAAGAKSVFGFAKGGVIREPVAGVGLKTGSGYTFGEQGPEAVVPLGGSDTSSGGNVVNVNINAIDSKSVVELMANNPSAVTGPIVNALNGGDRGLAMALRGSVL